MRCVPTQRNTRIWWIVAALLVFGGICYAIPIVCSANGVVIAGAVFQFMTVLSVVAAVFFVVRYQMTGFVYLIRPRSDISENGMETAYAGGGERGISGLSQDMLDFVVTKSQGSRPGAMECVMSLSDLVAVIPLSAQKRPLKKQIREKYQADGYVSYDYTLTLGVADALALVFIDGNRYAGIFIEPDEAMRAYFLSLGKTKRLSGE